MTQSQILALAVIYLRYLPGTVCALRDIYFGQSSKWTSSLQTLLFTHSWSYLPWTFAFFPRKAIATQVGIDFRAGMISHPGRVDPFHWSKIEGEGGAMGIWRHPLQISHAAFACTTWLHATANKLMQGCSNVKGYDICLSPLASFEVLTHHWLAAWMLLFR